MGTTAARQAAGPAPAAAAAAAPEPAAPAARPRWLVPAVIAATALAGAAAAKFVVVPRLAAPARTAAAPTKPTERAKLFRLDGLVVNPAGSQGTRFLMATVVVESPHDSLTAQLEAHEVEARDRVTTLLGAQSLDLLVAANARDSVRHLVAGALAPLLPPGTVLHVYLPQFVIQ